MYLKFKYNEISTKDNWYESMAKTDLKNIYMSKYAMTMSFFFFHRE